MIVVAPASRAPAIAASPTPPQPNTATLSPRRTAPVLIAAPTPAITPQPSSPAAVAGVSGSTLVLVGVPTPEMTIELPLLDVFGRGGALKSSWYGDCLPTRDFPMLVGLYQQGRLDLDAFVSEEIALDQVEEAFAKMHTGGVLRSVVLF